MTPEPTDPVVERVLASRKYAGLAPELVRRIVAEETPKAPNAGDAEKRVKRRLHQIFGAYAAPFDYAGVLNRLREAAAIGDSELVRAICRSAMADHASTRERLPIVEQFYRQVFDTTGPPTSILDIGCGLNPLAIPWMHLPAACAYSACDIDRRLVAFLGEVLPLLGVCGSAEARDVVGSPPMTPCDVALLLKTLPCLEQQRPGIGLDLLRSIPARWLIVSYPTRSLGGRRKGMHRTYSAAFAQMAETLARPYTALEFSEELVFVIAGSGGAQRVAD